MIPRNFIIEWRQHAPWISDAQVEQDLIICRALVELMGTKLRALFQRKKGRDLFDFWFVLKHHQINLQIVVKTFHHYLDKQGIQVSRAQFEQNLIEKVSSPNFVDDIRALLSPEVEPQWSLEEGLKMVRNQLFPNLSGEAWKGDIS